MSKRKNVHEILGLQGNVLSTNMPDWSFIYAVSAIKHPNYIVGDSVELPNGKCFVYCKSSGACYTGQGNAFNNAIPATGIDYSVLPTSYALGSKEIQMTNQGTVAQTEDGLQGGIIIINHSGTTDNSDLQIRGIIGNTSGGVSDVITIYLDEPLTAAVTAGTAYAFCMPSPYSAVQLATSGCQGIIGPAATYVSATGLYFWCQYKGRCWLAPQSGVGSTTYAREVVWRHDGSIQLRGTTAVNGLNGQVAGFIVDNNGAANGATEIMLTGAK